MNCEKIHGNLLGIKRARQEEIARLFRRRIPPEQITTHEFNRELARLSRGIGRQIGVLINRRGQVEEVMVGDARSILLPELDRSRSEASRFRGLRYLHTHLAGEPLSEEDLTDLALLRFDLIAALSVDEEGYPGSLYLAHLLPANPEGKTFEVFPPIPPGQLAINFQELIFELEREFRRRQPPRRAAEKEGAILVGVILEPRSGERNGRRPSPGAAAKIDGLTELRELAASAGVEVLDVVIQRRQQIHPRTVIGSGRLRELVIRAMQLGAQLVIFDRELTPGQVAALQALTDLKVIDRSQLILDIFAQRAKSREGKIQVELAQLRYNLPRLVGRGVDMSRLMGGIGGRGPGETKLELDRRRIRNRIHHLERELERVRSSRRQKRERRLVREMPVVSIIGYTNAGKSTLLNQFTNSAVTVADEMFATLDPASRRLRFPREREIIITDTVGFIHELPAELYEAFRSTLEELETADLFLHLVDASDPSWPGQMEAVEKILADLELLHTPRIVAFNKTDLLSPHQIAASLHRLPQALAISALDRKSLLPLLQAVEAQLFPQISSFETWQALGF